MGLAVHHGVLFDGLQHGGDDLVGLDLHQIDGLVDVKFLLYRRNAVLAGLGQIEAGPAGGPQLGDHFLVVGVGDFYRDSGFLGELFHQDLGCIALPREQAKRCGRRGCGDKEKGRENQQDTQRFFRHDEPPFLGKRPTNGLRGGKVTA